MIFGGHVEFGRHFDFLGPKLRFGVLSHEFWGVT